MNPVSLEHCATSYSWKVLIFTNYKETFEIYEEMLSDFYTEDGFSCFRRGMSANELEVNVCKFQNIWQLGFHLLSGKNLGAAP